MMAQMVPELTKEALQKLRDEKRNGEVDVYSALRDGLGDDYIVYYSCQLVGLISNPNVAEISG